MVNDSNIITINSIESKMKVNKFSGNQRQKTREGYNELKITEGNQTYYGVTMTVNNDGSVKFNGTATATTGGFLLTGNTNYSVDDFPYGEQLTFSCEGLVEGLELAIAEADSSGAWLRNIVVLNSTNPKQQITPTKGENAVYIRAAYTVTNGKTFNNIITYPMFYKGTENKPYEQYGASPSINYPSEIKAVGDNGSVEIKKINSNIMPIQTEKYWEYTENGIKNKANSVGKTITEFTIKKGQTIKIGFIAFTKPSENTTFTCQINDMENSSLNIARFNNFNLNQKYEFSYTAVEDVVFKYVLNGNSANEIFEFQLWANIENLEDYQRYEESSYNLPIQKPMLSGDYFDLERGKEVHKWIERELTGTENITLTDTVNGIAQFTFSQFYDGDYDTGYVNINALSNCYKGVPFQSSWLKDNSIALVGGYTARIMTSEYSTVEEFKQMLAEKYAEGNPVKIYYKLIKPKELGLTEEQKSVLQQLQNIILYDDTTNIILPDVYPILDYDVSKIIDTTTTFEASLDSNGYFVVPDYDIKCLISYSESDIPSMPEAVETSVNIPGRDGDIPLNTTYNPIPFTIVCYTEDNLTPEEKYAEETKMNKFLNSIKNNTIKLKLESKGKYYDVKYNGQLTTINYPKHLQFSIPLKSSSSYAKDIDEYYILGNGEEESDTIKEVGAVFVIEGPAQTPKISLNDYEMFYDNVLLSNTKLVIDSNKSTVTMINREGTATNAMRYYNHEFPKIQKGNNVLKVLSGIDEDRQVNVRWFDLKL